MDQSFILHRQRNFGEKVNATFQYIVLHYRTLALPLLVIAGPLALATQIASKAYQAELLNAVMGQQIKPSDFLALYLNSMSLVSFWVFFGLTVLSHILVGMVVYGHLLCYEEAPAEPITIRRVLAWVETDLLRVLLTSFLSACLIMSAWTFLIIPGIYVAVTLSLVTFVTMREDVGVGTAIRRCFTLIQGQWWATFGLLMVMFLIQIVLASGIQIPVQLILFGARLTNPVIQVIGNALLIVVGSLAIVPLYVAIALQYFNLLDHKEGVGLLHQIDSIGRPHSEPTSYDD